MRGLAVLLLCWRASLSWSSCEPQSALRDLDFIEIGTSSFDTLIQVAMNATVGLSVEAVKYYQDKLPNPPGVTKVNAAIVERHDLGSVDFYDISYENMKRHRLPTWLKGCGSVFQPHPQLLEQLRLRRLSKELIRHSRVRALTFAQLLKQERVRSINFLKLDVEGQEANILKGVLEVCAAHRARCPRKIMFEANKLRGATKDALVEQLKRHGYVVLVASDVSLKKLGPKMAGRYSRDMIVELEESVKMRKWREDYTVSSFEKMPHTASHASTLAVEAAQLMRARGPRGSGAKLIERRAPKAHQGEAVFSRKLRGADVVAELRSLHPLLHPQSLTYVVSELLASTVAHATLLGNATSDSARLSLQHDHETAWKDDRQPGYGIAYNEAGSLLLNKALDEQLIK